MNERELFRGKRIDNGEWVEGFIWVNKTATHETYYITDMDGNMHSIDHATRGQCTGLRDKNGALIFEGDIVIDDRSLHGVVEWDNKCSRYMVFSQVRGIKYVGYVGRDLPNEVVGNIHENKGLLEVRGKA